MKFFWVRPMRGLVLLCLMCCLMGGCMGAGGMGARNNATVVSNPPMTAVHLPAGSAVWVEVNDHSELGDVGEDVRSLLMALLQSDAGFLIAASAKDATGLVRVNILQMGLTSSENVNFDTAQGFGAGLTGAMLGLGVGSAVNGGKGALWGAGIGLALGFTAGGAAGSGTDDTWAMVADVQLSASGVTGEKSTAKDAGQNGGQKADVASRVAVTAQGRDMARDAALATLEDALIQEIVGHMQAR